MSRLAATFERLKREGRTGLVAFITTGFPDLASTPDLVRALVDGGADIVELGVPFSDPLADGATVQRSTHTAVMNGVTTADVIDVTRKLRDGGITVPLVAMGYLNPVLAYGMERFAADAAAAGLDGMIPVDVPVEESGPLRRALAAHDMDVICLLAPTSTDERIARTVATASGFVYCVSVAGTTGARGDLPEDLPEFIARVRRHTDLPLAVGFGVSRAEHVARIGQLCEAAVIGSAIIDVIDRAPPDKRAERLRDYVRSVTGRP
ncbi:MAG: tryptophan synthase subunit alpha [Chloroflexi bacterium]|nr:tryptophan synthase subunit alpha [Chloroflexota bacterium]